MPLFTMGCEAFEEGQRVWVLEKVGKLEECIGSFHVKGVRRALWDVWGEREGCGDEGRGEVCAGRLLGEFIDFDLVCFDGCDADDEQRNWSIMLFCFEG